MDGAAIATAERAGDASPHDRPNPLSPERSSRYDSDPLRLFGITRDAEVVWRTLLEEPALPPAELQRRCGLPADKVENAISLLLQSELVHRSTSNAGVRVVDPVLAIETHIARHERKVARQAEQLAMLRCQLPQLATKYSRGQASAGAEPGFEIVIGLDHVRHQIYLAAERARFETRSLDHAPAVEGFDHARETDISTLSRGVRERSIFAASALSEPGIFRGIEELHRFGHHVRTLPDVPTRLSIFDGDLVVLPVDPEDLSIGAIFIRTKSLIETFVYMFDRLWAEADPLFTDASDPLKPSGRAARVLELMAIGTKDERIARSLGVGVRTIRRDVAEIRLSLGVNSRAEIAAAAVRRGWLS